MARTGWQPRHGQAVGIGCGAPVCHEHRGVLSRFARFPWWDIGSTLGTTGTVRFALGVATGTRLDTR